MSFKAIPLWRMQWEKMWTNIEWAKSEKSVRCHDEATQLSQKKEAIKRFKEAEEACDLIEEPERKADGVAILNERRLKIFGVKNWG